MQKKQLWKFNLAMLVLFLFVVVMPAFDGRTVFHIGMDELMYRLTSDEIAEPGAFKFRPVTLRFGLRSYSAPSEVIEILKDSSPKVIGDYHSARKDICPQFNSLMLSFSMISDLDQNGELYTHFINNRLHAVYFSPQEYASYLDALKASGIKIRSVNSFLMRFKGRHIKKAELNSVKQVLWYDVRLDEEISAWFRQCS